MAYDEGDRNLAVGYSRVCNNSVVDHRSRRPALELSPLRIIVSTDVMSDHIWRRCKPWRWMLKDWVGVVIKTLTIHVNIQYRPL